MPSTTAINKRNVHVLTSSTLEYDFGNSLHRCHQIKMGSLARTQSRWLVALWKGEIWTWDKRGRKTAWQLTDRGWPADWSDASTSPGTSKTAFCLRAASEDTTWTHLDFSFQNYKRTWFWCFRPPSFWYFVKICWHMYLTMVSQNSNERLILLTTFFWL